jgi:hypothetical protein
MMESNGWSLAMLVVEALGLDCLDVDVDHELEMMN